MAKVTLKDKMVELLEIQDLDDESQEKICQILVQLAFEKSLDELMEEFSDEELEKIEKDFSRKKENAAVILKNNFRKIKKFGSFFSQKLEEVIAEFKKRNGKS